MNKGESILNGEISSSKYFPFQLWGSAVKDLDNTYFTTDLLYDIERSVKQAVSLYVFAERYDNDEQT